MSKSESQPLPTPLAWRVLLGALVVLLTLAAYQLRDTIGLRGQSAFGVVCVIGLVAMFSTNLRALNKRTLMGGFLLQGFLAWFTLKFTIYGLDEYPDGFRPGYELFHAIADGAKKLMEFTFKGSEFVFGPLASPVAMDHVFGRGRVFIFAFAGLPVIIFVSSFFKVLYYLGVLQMVVRIFARGMVYLMRTSGAESLTSAANVFMGQTEAPLIIKPFIANMTASELFSMMVSGMAHISGALMGVYIAMGADQVSILTTCVMAAPGGLYLSKLFMPETEVPETLGVVKTEAETANAKADESAKKEMPPQNVIDAAATGAAEGMTLAINVAAMLIAFLAFLAMVDFLLGLIPVAQSLAELLHPDYGWRMLGNWLFVALGYYVIFLGARKLLELPFLQRFAPTEVSFGSRLGLFLIGFFVYLGVVELILNGLPTGQAVSLKLIFSHLFAPLAFLMGIPEREVFDIANLLGTKLSLNEFVAYGDLQLLLGGPGEPLSKRSQVLATFALTGFANFGSIGIQLGGIGAMAPNRRPDLARFGLRALYVGFLATILNACIAGILIDD